MLLRQINYHQWQAIREGEACLPDKYSEQVNELILLDIFRDLTPAEQDNTISFMLYTLDVSPKKQKLKTAKEVRPKAITIKVQRREGLPLSSKSGIMRAPIDVVSFAAIILAPDEFQRF